MNLSIFHDDGSVTLWVGSAAMPCRTLKWVAAVEADTGKRIVSYVVTEDGDSKETSLCH